MNTIVSSPPVSAKALLPPPVGSDVFFTDELDALRSEALTPRFLTVAEASIEGRKELVRGAELLRLHGPQAARGATIQGHQVLLADVLAAPHDVLGLLMPRRSFKTSTLFSLAMGRIAEREDYMVSYTMTTTALKARQRFRDDIVKPLERMFPDEKQRPFKIIKAGGAERVEWLETGSTFAFLAPKGDSFRSDAWDWIILDEAGQADPEMGADILDGAAATQDTRPDSHITITGTAPKYRTGNLLWEALEKGRKGEAGYSILEYSVDQDTKLDDVLEWEQVAPLIIDMHPAIDHPTPLAAVQKSFNLIGPKSFAREYLGVAGTEGSVPPFLNLVNWAAGTQTGKKPTPPARFGMGLSINLNGTSSALVAAWRDADGKACLFVLAHGAGTKWVANAVRTKWRAYKMPLVYDAAVGTVQVEVEALGKGTVRPRLDPQKWTQIATAASLMKKEIEDANVRHWDQAPLTRAVEVAQQRSYQDKRWAFKRMSDEDDITCLEAAAMALRAFDESKPKTPYKGHLQT